MNANPLLQSLRELSRWLNAEGADYALVGGLAVGIWAEPRATVDIGFLISLNVNDYLDLKDRLVKSGEFVFIHDKPMTFGRISLLRASLKSNSAIAVDFLFADDDFKRSLLTRKAVIKLEDFTLQIASAEDMIVLKLLSTREQDRLDAEKIAEIQKDSLDTGYLRTWSERLGIEPLSAYR